MGFPIAGLFVHWIFQGMLYMDKTERLFKIFLDVILTSWICIFLYIWFPFKFALPIAFFTAHTLNFLFNGQLWTALKSYGKVHNSREDYDKYVESLISRIRNEPYFMYAVICGSYASDNWEPTSDLDLRLIYFPGLRNGVSACWFIFLEKSRALFNLFALDVYLLDGTDSMNRFRNNESLLVILNNLDKTSKPIIKFK